MVAILEKENRNFMIYFIIGIVGTILWIGFEIWRAPLLKEEEDGSWKTIKPTKSWKDLFKNSPHDDIYS